MQETGPGREVLSALLGQPLYQVFQALCEQVNAKYEMERLWNSGYRDWVYEYKYRRGGKTLCTFYLKEGSFAFMVILGRQERKKFESEQESYSEDVRRIYADTHTYHDGKWLWFQPTDARLFPDFEKLLLIKRRPNKK